MSINVNTLTTLTNEANLIADALKTIDRDHAERLAKLNADHKALRGEIVQELAALNRALKALRAPIVMASGSAPTAGKKLSDAHRQKIKDALQRRSAEKAAAKTAPADTKPEPAPAAETAREEQSAPAELSVTEGQSVTLAIQDAVNESRAAKLTELERDVLVNGILLNNFQDGAEGEQAIWSDQIIPNGSVKKVTAKQLPGVVSSLIKKGLVTSDGEAVLLTDAGISVAKAAASMKAVR